MPTEKVERHKSPHIHQIILQMIYLIYQNFLILFGLKAICITSRRSLLIHLFRGRVIPVLTYLLTPWSRVLLEKLTGLQLVKKFPTFYGTQRFITAFTSVRHLSLSWATSIQSIRNHVLFISITIFNMCSNISVSTVTRVSSNVFVSVVMHLYLHWII